MLGYMLEKKIAKQIDKKKGSCLTCRYISWIEIISMPKNKYEHDWIYDEVGIYKSDYDRTFLYRCSE